jgi:hypothetical protein
MAQHIPGLRTCHLAARNMGLIMSLPHPLHKSGKPHRADRAMCMAEKPGPHGAGRVDVSEMNFH